MTNTTKFDTGIIKGIIEDYLKNMVEDEFDNAIKKTVARIELRKGEVIAGIMLDVMKVINFHEYSDKLVIEIRKPDSK